MDNAEFEREAQAILDRRPRQTPAYPSAANYARAVEHYLVMSTGRPVEHPDATARAWISDALDLSAVRSATGLGMADFSGLLTDALGVAMQEQFADVTADIGAVSRTVELIDYKTSSLAAVGLGAPGEVDENFELPRLPFEIGEATRTGLREFGGRVSFSRQAWSTFGVEITNAIGEYGRVFGLLELQLMAQTIEAGSPATASGSLDATGLATAAKTLREQVNSAGQVTNAPLGALLVPADLEGAARKMRRDHGWDYAIAVNPYLSSASVWYAVGPAASSPVVRLILRGSGKPRLYSNMKESPAAQFAVSFDVNYALIDAPGLVQLS